MRRRFQRDFAEATTKGIIRLCFILHVSPVVKMPHLFPIEVCYSGQVAPLFKAHFPQQLEARIIAFQDNCKDVPDLERGTRGQCVLHQSGGNSPAMIRLCNVVTDFCRKAERGPARAIST